MMAGSPPTKQPRGAIFEQIEDVEALWPSALEKVAEIDLETWRSLKAVLWHRIYPQNVVPGGELTPEQPAEAHAFVRSVLEDLAPRAEGRPGLSAALRWLGAKVGAELRLEIDPRFEIFFKPPEPSIEQMEAVRKKARAAQDELAVRWASEDVPESVARTLGRYLREAAYLDLRGDSELLHFGERLAQEVKAPEAWLRAFLLQQLPSSVTAPLLRRIAEERRPGWRTLLAEALELEILASHAVTLVLQDREPPPELLERALEKAPDLPWAVTAAWGGGKAPPLPTLERLLRHPERLVAVTAAVEESSWEPEGSIRPEVAESWRAAVLRSAELRELQGTALEVQELYLEQVLRGEPDLALAWIRRWLEGADASSKSAERAVATAALETLDTSQRSELVGELDNESIPWGFLPPLIRRDPGLYARFLGRPQLAEHHLDPLAGKPDAAWLELALLALDAGYEAEEIASAAYLNVMHAYWGGGEEYWRQWADAFRSLEDDPRREAREVAPYGRAVAERHLEEARAKQRRRELNGASA